MIKGKKILKVLSIATLGLGVIGGAIAITNHFVKKDEVSIRPTYEVGGLNAQGRYEEDIASIYTKEKFACEGLKATLDFDSTINYQIFYYDILDNFISSSDVLTEGYSGNAPINGAYARIEITPTNDDDKKISWNEKGKYSKQLNLKVSKNAESNVQKKFKSYKGFLMTVVDVPLELNFVEGYLFNTTTQEIEESSVENFDTCTTNTLLNVSDFKKLNWVRGFDANIYNVKIYVHCFDDTLNYVNSSSFNGSAETYSLDISKSTYILLHIQKETEENPANFSNANDYYPKMFELSDK